MIDRVFVLMLENRSFDHMLGFAALRGTDSATGRPTDADGLAGTEFNLTPSGAPVKVSQPAAYAIPVDPGHEFTNVLTQLCGAGARYQPGGAYPPADNSGFVRDIVQTRPTADPGLVMQGFGPDQLPVLTALAREFAVCDRWFSSMPGPTWPNRLFAHGASAAGLDDSPALLRPATAVLDGYRFPNGTIYDRLDAAGLPWHIVEGDAFPQALAISGMALNALKGRIIGFDDFRRGVAEPGYAAAYTFIEPNYGYVIGDGDFKCGNSQHPLDDVTRGEQLIKDVYEAVRRSPHWQSSLLIITYDEHGGFFDHVPPPGAPAPGDGSTSDDNRHGFAFDQLGVRVPAVIVSPQIPRNVIDHTVHDHASILATVEALFGLQPLTERDRLAASLVPLLSLPTARADAPFELPPPAVSGIADCDDVEQAVADELLALAGKVTGPLEPALVGFVHVAMSRMLHLGGAAAGSIEASLGGDREQLVQAYNGISSKLDAVQFLRGVEQRYRRFRGDRSPAIPQRSVSNSA